jgi:hypothetical protein
VAQPDQNILAPDVEAMMVYNERPQLSGIDGVLDDVAADPGDVRQLFGCVVTLMYEAVDHLMLRQWLYPIVHRAALLRAGSNLPTR